MAKRKPLVDGQSTEAAAVVVEKQEAVRRDDLVEEEKDVEHVLLFYAPAVGQEDVSRWELLLVVLHHPLALDNQDVHHVLAEGVVEGDECDVGVGDRAKGAGGP